MHTTLLERRGCPLRFTSSDFPFQRAQEDSASASACSSSSSLSLGSMDDEEDRTNQSEEAELTAHFLVGNSTVKREVTFTRPVHPDASAAARKKPATANRKIPVAEEITPKGLTSVIIQRGVSPPTAVWFEGDCGEATLKVVSRCKPLLVNDNNMFELPSVKGAFKMDQVCPEAVLLRVIPLGRMELTVGVRSLSPPVCEIPLPVDPATRSFETKAGHSVFISTRVTGHLYQLTLASFMGKTGKDGSKPGDVFWESDSFELKTARQYRRLRSQGEKQKGSSGGGPTGEKENNGVAPRMTPTKPQLSAASTRISKRTGALAADDALAMLGEEFSPPKKPRPAASSAATPRRGAKTEIMAERPDDHTAIAALLLTLK